MQIIKILPNDRRALIVIIFISIMTILQIIILGRAIFLESTIREGYSWSDLKAINFDPFINIISLVRFLIYIGSIIFYLRWFKRAYQNVGLLGDNLRYSKGMSIGAWFIPGFHWIGPIQMMLDMFRSTESKLIKYQLISKSRYRYFIITFWWSLYILVGLLSIYSMVFLPSKNVQIEVALWIYQYQIILRIFDIFLGISVVLVIINYKRMEKKLAKTPYIKVEEFNHKLSDILDEGMINS